MLDAIDALKRRYDFPSWAGRTRSAERMLIRNVAFRARETTEWEMVRKQRREAPGLPPCTETFWRYKSGGPEAFVRVDTWECDSTLAAHELLIRMLANYESPLVDRRQDIDIGDVMFGPPGDAAALFARGNLVIGLTRASRATLPVLDLARALDHDTMARPEMPAEAHAAAPPAAAAPAEGSVRLDADASTDTTVKAFATAGDLRFERDQIVYSPEPGGEGEITVYNVPTQGRPRRRMARVKAET